jgi:hypothetical protein
MGLIYDNNEEQQESNTTRDPLVDITGEPLPSSELESTLKLRRRNLSDVQGEAAAQPSEPELSVERPKIATIVEDRPEEPPAPATPASPGLIDLNTLPDTSQPPGSAEPPCSTEAEPVLEQAQPKSGRPRLTSRGPHAGVAEPPQVGAAPNGLANLDPEPDSQTAGVRTGRPRLTSPVPAAEEPECAPKPSRPRLASSAPAPEESESAAKTSRPRLTPSAPAPEESESAAQASQPHVPAAAPEVEAAEPRVRAHRRRLGEQKTAADAADAGGQSRLDPARVRLVVAELQAKQNLPIALAAGMLAAVAGAVFWAMVTITTNHQVGYMALAVGFLVGGAVRVSGRGVSKSFGWLGAGLSVGGCLLGNFLANCVSIARETDLSVNAVLAHLGQNPTGALGLMVAVHPIDLVFYGIAIYGGYRFSFWRLTEARIRRLA